MEPSKTMEYKVNTDFIMDLTDNSPKAIILLAFLGVFAQSDCFGNDISDGLNSIYKCGMEVYRTGVVTRTDKRTGIQYEELLVMFGKFQHDVWSWFGDGYLQMIFYDKIITEFDRWGMPDMPIVKMLVSSLFADKIIIPRSHHKSLAYFIAAFNPAFHLIAMMGDTDAADYNTDHDGFVIYSITQMDTPSCMDASQFDKILGNIQIITSTLALFQ